MISLLPLDSKKRLGQQYRLRLVTVGLFLGCGVLVLGYVLAIPSFFLTQSKEQLIEQEWEFLRATAEVGSFEELRDVVGVVNRRLDVMRNMPPYQLSDALLSELLVAKTADVTFRSITYAVRPEEGARFELRGQARNRAALVSFIRRLEANPKYEVLQAPVSNFVDAIDLAFMLEVAILTSEQDSHEETN